MRAHRGFLTATAVITLLFLGAMAARPFQGHARPSALEVVETAGAHQSPRMR